LWGRLMDVWAGLSRLGGKATGRRVLVGGFVSGLKARPADVTAVGRDEQQVLSSADKVITWYRKTGKAKRPERVIDEIGFGKIYAGVGASAVLASLHADSVNLFFGRRLDLEIIHG